MSQVITDLSLSESSIGQSASLAEVEQLQSELKAFVSNHDESISISESVSQMYSEFEYVSLDPSLSIAMSESLNEVLNSLSLTADDMMGLSGISRDL
jgi:hypothetical protein